MRNAIKKSAVAAFCLLAACSVLAAHTDIRSSFAPAAVEAAGKVNINTDGFDRLIEIPGIDEVLAAKMIKYRKEKGGFKTVYDMMKIPEITGEMFEKIKDSVTVGEKSAAPAPAVTAQPAPSRPQPPAPAAPQPRPAAPPVSTIPAGESAGENGDVPGIGVSTNASTPSAPAPGARIADESEEGEAKPASDASSSEELSDEGRTASPRPASADASRPAKPIRGRIADDIKRIDITADNYYKIIMSLMRMGKYEKAEKSISEFIEKFPGDPRMDDADYLLAACTEERSRYPEAIEIYKRVYENKKSEVRGIALFRIAVCQDIMGNSREALENYRKYISEFPESSCVKDAESRVSGMVRSK